MLYLEENFVLTTYPIDTSVTLETIINSNSQSKVGKAVCAARSEDIVNSEHGE